MTTPAGSAAEPGPLTRRVLDYTAVIEQIVEAEGEPDWGPLTAFVAVDDFRRVGTFMEVHDWTQYLTMLTQWAGSVERFETTVRRVREVDDAVYYEIEERHHRGGVAHVVNSMTVFGFDTARRIRSLAVYLQAPR